MPHNTRDAACKHVTIAEREVAVAADVNLDARVIEMEQAA